MNLVKYSRSSSDENAVSERYAYSAYGTPVFMTGASVVQTSSAVGFETLYAGYRYDGTTPQMYYVRNRFLLPMIGTWNKRDPLGYEDGMESIPPLLANGTDVILQVVAPSQFPGKPFNLFEYVSGRTLDMVDPTGLRGHHVTRMCGSRRYTDQVGPDGDLHFVCCSGKLYRRSEVCCLDGKAVSTAAKESVRLSFRPANLPGGNWAEANFAKRHCSVKTSCGETGLAKVGAGVPGQGAEGLACTLCTEMVDHTDQYLAPSSISVFVTVKSCCFARSMALHKRKGYWIPLFNDCNTVVQTAVNNCGGSWNDAYNEYLRKRSEQHEYNSY